MYQIGMTKKLDAKTRLAKDLEETATSQREFALSVGSYQSIISRILSGRIQPSLKLAVSIEKATDGRVPASLWVEDVA